MTPKICRVLVIDDSASDRADLRQMLLRGSNRRYRFSEADLGTTALELVREAQAAEPDRPAFDCILLDFHLPDMDAHQILAALCAGSHRPPYPIVVITGWNGVDAADGNRLLRVGAQDYIGKSWTTPESLTRALDNAMDRYECITQRELEARSLGESEQRYRNLFDSIDECLCVLEKVEGSADTDSAADGRVDFRCVDMNPAFSARYGMSGNVGKTLRQMLPDEPEHWFDIYDRVWVSGVASRFEGSDADLCELELYAFRIGGPGARKVVVIRKDISQRKQSERQLRAQAQTLTDADRRKDEFLAMLSHELRNPLAPISNAVHLLRLQGSQDPIQQKARAVIERQVGQLNHLVNDLLEVSRITTGRVVLSKNHITFDDVVARAIETVQPLMVQRGHQLNLLLPPQPVWLLADPARLEQVVVNLLTNAAKFTDPGGQIELTIRLEVDSAVLKVRDNGIGITAQLLPDIFQMFRQDERSLDRSQGGLGIGLCLVERLVELHDGTVEAQSVVGQGSEFTVRLPAADAPVNVRSTSPGLLLDLRPSPPAGQRVLVVDDNRDAAESLATLLSFKGHEVRLAHDGPTAVAVAIAFKPDAVSLDIGLPGLDGYETARQMRQHAALRDTVLIAVTGYGQEADRLRSRDAGFDHHLVKPASLEALEKILTRTDQP